MRQNYNLYILRKYQIFNSIMLKMREQELRRRGRVNIYPLLPIDRFDIKLSSKSQLSESKIGT